MILAEVGSYTCTVRAEINNIKTEKMFAEHRRSSFNVKIVTKLIGSFTFERYWINKVVLQHGKYLWSYSGDNSHDTLLLPRVVIATIVI
jgi:hypothetical protein